MTIALDWIAEDIAELAAEELTNQIVYTIEHQARDVFQKAMDKLVIPWTQRIFLKCDSQLISILNGCEKI